MTRATIADVARLAGVSSATVSHVMNETRYVARETREAVLKAIEQLDYAPSHVARSLMGRKTFTVGLLISDVSNPFYHGIILGVEELSLSNDYSVFLFNASNGPERSLSYVHSMIERRTDGIILMTSQLDPAALTELNRYKIPTVVLDWREFDTGAAGVITLNFEPGINEAVEHLIGLGHRHFAHVCGESNSWSARVRKSLFLGSLASHGIDPSGVLLVEGNSRIDGGRAALARLLEQDRPPSAVFAVNDVTAFGLLFEANRRGVSIPGDLSVIGLDNIALASEVSPPLTTIALPSFEIGRRAMSMLMELMNRPDEAGAVAVPPRYVFDTSLVIRGSTAPPRA